MKVIIKNVVFSIIILTFFSCKNDIEINRQDCAQKLDIQLEGSIQNPAFSPDGKTLIFESPDEDPDKSKGTCLRKLTLK